MEISHRPARTVFAPKDGIIAKVFASEGAPVGAGGKLFAISTLQENAAALQIETTILSSQLLLDRITGDRLKDFTDNAAAATTAARSYLAAVQEHAAVVADLVADHQALQVDLTEIEAVAVSAQYLVAQSLANQDVMDADTSAMRVMLTDQIELARTRLRDIQGVIAFSVVNSPFEGLVTWHSFVGGYVPGGAPVCDIVHR